MGWITLGTRGGCKGTVRFYSGNLERLRKVPCLWVEVKQGPSQFARYLRPHHALVHFPAWFTYDSEHCVFFCCADVLLLSMRILMGYAEDIYLRVLRSWETSSL